MIIDFDGHNSETDSIASMSSLGLLETPTDLDNQFSGVHSHDDHLRRMIPIQHAYDFSHNTSGSSAISDSNYPAFSSLEVEISIVADSPPIPGSPYQSENPMTPQRASQVFGFLTEKRKSTFANDMKGPLLGLPQQHINALSSQTSHFSDSSSESLSTQTSEKPPMHVDNTRIPAQSTSVGLRRTQSQSYSPTSTNSSPHDYNPRSAHPQCRNSIPQDDILKPHQVQVIITAPTPSDDTQITRIPRGPRPSPRQYTKNLPQQPDVENGNRISLQLYDAHSTLLESTRLQNIRSGPPVAPARDPFTPIPPRQRRTHHKAMSCGPTSTFAFPESGHPPPVSDVLDTFNCAGKGSGSHGKPAYGEGKENDLTSHASFGLPVTPVRSRSLFGFSGKPSPTSSSDLSPVGQQLMMNLRQQRMSAREAERQKKGMRGSGTARVK
jgi:hypothetical protein